MQKQLYVAYLETGRCPVGFLNKVGGNDVRLTNCGQRQVIEKWSLSTSETIRIRFCFRRVFELVITRNQSTLDGGRGDNSRP